MQVCEEVPKSAIILNQLHIVEYFDVVDEEIYRMDLSSGSDGEDIAMGKQLELVEWARSFAVTPLIAELVHEYVFGESEDEDPDEEVSV